ncbi:DUF6232 family protein [Streptomyces sp. NRRL S-350]|uniref:DUF6232 family protein n=1 Tax=Streptomyces sp. NRRL S-350 TaxID=1463902 RepID=UPI000569F22B|nr:DUF6232 family protein [Streptomyces sp. NRRL S-350]
MTRNVITVSVSRRVLWVGGDAYPLQHIARARQLVWWPPKRSWTIIRFVRQVFALAFAATVLGALLQNSTEPGQAAAVPGALLVAGLAYCIYRLVTRLRQRPLYKLVIETSNASTTAVVSHDPRQIGQLIEMIMDAIDNPQAEFAVQVENVHIGDRINQYGNDNIGKQVGR